MTIPTFSGLQTALSGLQVAQAGIDTTGQNIANANTPGYSREVVNQTETAPFDFAGGNSLLGAQIQLGTGATLTDITRIRDQFLDNQYWAQNAVAGNANQMASQLSQVQTAVNEPSSDGISQQLTNFWAAWQALGNSPSGASAASALQAVVSAGQALASTFNSVANQMGTVQQQANTQYNALTGTNGQFVQDLQQIQQLNGQIAQAESAGQSPNTLLDQRDKALDDLSGLAAIQVAPQSDGTVTVTMNGASQPLVQGTTVNWPQTLTGNPGGELGALQTLSSSSGPIGSLLTTLNNIAGQVIGEVNSIQGSPPFFSGSDAGSIAVNPQVVQDPSLIQTSIPNGQTENLAQQVADLQNSNPAGSGYTNTIDASYASFVGQVGSTVQAANSSQSTAQSLLSAIDNQRQSVSGVSLDEEMTNLIQYQQAYQASARVMNTIDETINDLITTVGGGA